MADLMQKPVRVIGLGNRFRGDDVAGIVLAKKLRAERIAGLEVLLHFGDGSSLMPLWSQIDRVVMVDAVSGGGPSGRLLCFDLQSEILPKGLLPVSSHAFGLLEALQMARNLHQKLPTSFILFGITAERFSLGSEPSIDLELLYKTFLNRVQKQLAIWNISEETIVARAGLS